MLFKSKQLHVLIFCRKSFGSRVYPECNKITLVKTLLMVLIELFPLMERMPGVSLLYFLAKQNWHSWFIFSTPLCLCLLCSVIGSQHNVSPIKLFRNSHSFVSLRSLFLTTLLTVTIFNSFRNFVSSAVSLCLLAECFKTDSSGIF